ncbi:MAG: DUF115 domain-containing protein [Defluviitaleaceae bacterium]|nr:DUF115 domain-containing protein [Defluviitaleaceae bacterium]
MNSIDWKQTENLLEKNIQFIQNSPRIHADVSKLRHLNENDYRIIFCEDGNATIEKKHSGGFIRFHSAYEPQREGQILAEARANEENEGRQYLFIGLGFGYIYNHLLPKTEAQNAQVVIYEPSYDIFNYFIRLFDISKLFKGYSLRLHVAEGAINFPKILTYFSHGRIADVERISTLSYYNAFKDDILTCMEQVQNFNYRDRINKDTSKYFELEWATHPIINFPDILKSPWYGGLKDVLNGRPAVLVAAGPSLNKNVHLLKEIQGRVFVISAYTAIKTLEKNGIRPDMYVSIDSHQTVYDVSDDYKIEEIPFLLHPNVPPRMLEFHNENNFLLLQHEQTIGVLLNALNKKIITIPTIGGSVVHFIATLLAYMGAETIVMLGQDLAFTGGKHHAAEYTEGLSEDAKNATASNMNNLPLEVEDVYGEMVPTNKAFKNYILQFEKFAHNNLSSFTMVDATEGGAKIGNTKIMSLREAIDTYFSEFTDTNYTNELITQARKNGKLFLEDDKDKAIKLFEKMLVQCENLLDLTPKTEKAAEKIMNLFKYNKIPTKKELKKPRFEHLTLIDEIRKNSLALDTVCGEWPTEFVRAQTMQPEDEHEALFFTRITSELFLGKTSLIKSVEKVLKSVIEKLKQEL